MRPGMPGGSLDSRKQRPREQPLGRHAGLLQAGDPKTSSGSGETLYRRSRLSVRAFRRPPATRDVPQHPARPGFPPVASKATRQISRECTPMPRSNSKIADDWPHLNPSRTEIGQEAQAQLVRRQVIDALRNRRIVQRTNRRQFNQDATANQQVGHLLANNDSVVMR